MFIPRNTDGRWLRLERYARWKQMRFPIELLPEDILRHVCNFLPRASDLLALIYAMGGEDAVLYMQCKPWCEAPESISALTDHYVVRQSIETVIHLLYHTSLTDAAFFHASSTQHTIAALINWSPFSLAPPKPVAEFKWENERACIRLDMPGLVLVAQNCVCKQLPTVRVTLHHRIVWGERVFFGPELRVVQLSLYPAKFIDGVDCTKRRRMGCAASQKYGSASTMGRVEKQCAHP